MGVGLRRLRAQDGDQVLAWRNSPEVAAFMYTDRRIGPDEHAAWLSRALDADDRRYWVIELDGSGVGVANLARIDRANHRCEWAFYLADPATRGRGVGACVEYAVLEHVFAPPLELNKLWCEVLIDNTSVWRLHERFGFQREALFRDHVWKGGRFHDVVGLGLLAADWREARAACADRLRATGWAPEQLVIADD
jgi:UDP-4-amino-4,6-dideoxy-N-acetyl-beta-L-altrosamine N-acetyltransferase